MKNLYIDQYGNKFYASTVRELRKKLKTGVAGSIKCITLLGALIITSAML